MEQTYNHKYIATAADDQVVSTGRAILHKIICGADVNSAVIEISDSASDGDGNLVAKLSGNTLMTSLAGGVELNLVCNAGITIDITAQTAVTVLWKPI